jgi:hypothetical protein
VYTGLANILTSFTAVISIGESTELGHHAALLHEAHLALGHRHIGRPLLREQHLVALSHADLQRNPTASGQMTSTPQATFVPL